MTTVLRIQSTVFHHYGVTADSILGRRRFANLAWARQVAMHFTAKFCGNSDAEIGLMFNRTGNDVRHARKQVKNISETEDGVRQDLEALEAKLTAAIKKEAA